MKKNFKRTMLPLLLILSCMALVCLSGYYHVGYDVTAGAGVHFDTWVEANKSGTTTWSSMPVASQGTHLLSGD